MPASYSKSFLLLSFSIAAVSLLAQQKKRLPESGPLQDKLCSTDWLVQPIKEKAGIFLSHGGKDIVLYNGLVKRSFRVSPNVACFDYKNMSNGQQLLRAVKPEAKVIINSKEYDVGGLKGQAENAYLLPEWLDNFSTDSADFQLAGYQTDTLAPFLKWKPSGWLMNKNQPSGKMLSFVYRSPIPR